MSMFQKSIINSVKQDESKVALCWASFQKFLEKVEYIKTVKEEKYQDGFLVDIFENCLGYTLDMTNPKSFNLEREKKNETDGKKADGVIYVDNKVVGVIELKGQDTKNLDKIETQAFNYHASHSNSKYIIISNFDELRFYVDKKTAYEKFNLFTLNYEEFKKLHLLISYESIKDDVPLKLKEKTNSFEQDISKKLYKDFSSFRTLLFENIVKNNLGNEALASSVLNGEALNQQTLLRLTQKLCDRIIFILFAEDRDLLRANMIKEIREEFINQKFTNYTLYDIYKFYFEAINKGNDKLQIPQYNGGLFATDLLLDSLIIDDFILDENVQILSNYDFASEISVNILGHIFEQSLTDLEELQANIENINFDKTKSKRKKDGVFYTPEYITRYIVENTLGKMCSEKREELQIGNGILIPSNPKKLTKQEQQTKDNLQEYKNWLLNLKILDPACGSGAFLNQALEYLISEHKNLQNDLALMGDLFASYMVEEEILEHNLYGVDINEDAVEIAKLSLWLRTAKRGRPLTKLVDKIKCGNSLIDDKNVVANAFVWEEEFKEVFENGGFDLVVGNPPYGATLNKEEKEYFYSKFETVEYQLDTYTLFMEKAHKILKTNAKLAFIVPSTWLTMFYFKTLRKYLIENSYFENLLLFRYQVFEDVTAETSIITLTKNKEINEKINTNFYDNSNEIETKISKYISQNDWISSYELGFNILFNGDKLKVIEKILKDSFELEKIVDVTVGIKPYQTNKGTPKQTSDDVKNRVFDSDYKIDETYYNYIVGGSINKFIINPSKTNWLKYGKFLAEPRQSLNFFQKKIMVRQTSDKIISAIDYQGLLSLNNVHNIVVNDEKYSYEALVCILNSKLIDFYYKFLVPEEGRTFAEVKVVNLKRLPIVNFEFNQEPFIQKADLMLELNKKLQETKQNFYDELKLEKLTTKLLKFEELEFDDFIKEYTKSKKIKFVDKLEERNFKNDWKALFENDKKEVLEIQNQINITDKEIDQMVYKLYDLIQDETKIVENNE
ncbi:Eco57I restriction-modification methylase domain-containing protein [Aliarcobacter cryaerophilus]|uniref:Eco57I restriction-modification methylase domain-containing protein n=1 Tax=Aliarcobacter cryaerophilus TaxID=28198 RepID=UPI0021B2B13D|nr:N-6 DNA methylase [Aliarcobacter cryaerophilus]MCT7472625.1 N-6 DNA methylase [Aliarcobacter cryaerophilus]MCT7483783.1 N-6 DNA methylase [Aliarcobacter cryaerophilus]